MSTQRGVAFLLGLLVMAACGGDTGSADRSAGAAGRPDGWIDHQDPAGFRVRHPEDWKVEVQDRQVVTVRGPKAEGMVAVFPFFLSRPAEDPLQVLREVPAPIAALFPGARIERSGRLPGRATDAVASLAYGREGSPGRATVLVSLDGPSGMLYAIAAPAARFEELRPTLLSILQTLRFVEPSPDAAGDRPRTPRVSYVAFQDPRESAFTVEVPRDWTVSGGLFRLAPVDTRPAIEAVSPDGGIRVALGDPELPPFTLPNEMLAAG
ncbi:MAG TPA: hypothetical protein VHG28_17375, partial [Longimicrobiaceae bacterium]|nr:hypothetical protein [Longimicrobiaceae bacterium]